MQAMKIRPEEVAAKFLEELGTPKNMMGYHYLREAVLVYRPGMSFTNELYPRVATKFSTTPGRVERAMRHAIEVSMTRCPQDVCKEYFGNTLNPNKGKPTTSEFIATLAEKLENAMED